VSRQPTRWSYAFCDLECRLLRLSPRRLPLHLCPHLLQLQLQLQPRPQPRPQPRNLPLLQAYHPLLRQPREKGTLRMRMRMRMRPTAETTTAQTHCTTMSPIQSLTLLSMRPAAATPLVATCGPQIPALPNGRAPGACCSSVWPSTPCCAPLAMKPIRRPRQRKLPRLR
jgi:hypothetical protein